MKRRSFFKIALGAAVAYSAGLPVIKSAPAQLIRCGFDPAQYMGEWRFHTIDPAPRYGIVNGAYQRVHPELAMSALAGTNSNAPGAILDRPNSAS